MFKSLNRGISAPIAIIIIVVCALLAGGTVVYQYYGMPKEEIKPTEGEEIVTDLELAENIVEGYENALKTRNRDEVLPYTTGELREEVQGWPPVFGTSNPHPGGCEILSSEKINETEFEVKARHFEEYTGKGRIGYMDNIYTVVKTEEGYFISSIEPGEYIDLSKKEPYIEVLSPNGGEIFKEGQDISITWISEGVNNVYIHAYYYDENNNIGNPEEFSFNSGECRLTYEPVSAATGGYITGGSSRCGKMPAGNRIKIAISGQATDIKDQSDDYFSIVGEDETADWKTYRNEEYGFEIDYPVDELDFSEDLSNVFSLCKEGSREWEINYISDAQMLGCIFGIILSLDSEYINYDWDREYIEDFYIKGSGISVVDTETKKIITDSGEIGQIRYGSAAISLGGDLDGPIDFVVFPLKLKTKVLVLYSFGFELDEILNQMLSTFRFLE